MSRYHRPWLARRQPSVDEMKQMINDRHWDDEDDAPNWYRERQAIDTARRSKQGEPPEGSP